MTIRIVRLTIRVERPPDSRSGCRLHLLAQSTGRNVWGTVVDLGASDQAALEWLDRRVPRACQTLGGELLADVLAELGGEVQGRHPLPTTPAAP